MCQAVNTLSVNIIFCRTARPTVTPETTYVNTILIYCSGTQGLNVCWLIPFQILETNKHTAWSANPVQLLNVLPRYMKGNTQGLFGSCCGSSVLEVDIYFKADRNISQYLTVLQSVVVALLLEVTGHVPVLQLLISSSEPGHSVPPWDGGGSAQSRDLLCAPSPHVVLQELQLLHGDQLPSSCTSSALLLGLFNTI